MKLRPLPKSDPAVAARRAAKLLAVDERLAAKLDDWAGRFHPEMFAIAAERLRQWEVESYGLIWR